MDILNQLAKKIAHDLRNTDYTSNTYHRNHPLIERARDAVTCNFPFQMEFPSVHGQKTRITFIFLEPIVEDTCGGG